VVHQRGFQIYRHPDHGRIRFQGPEPRGISHSIVPLISLC
jgi:hypothetical protein